MMLESATIPFTRASNPKAKHKSTRQRHTNAACRVSIYPKYGNKPCQVSVQYLWSGATHAPTVIIQGGISADRHVYQHQSDETSGWWSELVGHNKAIDLNKVNILSVDWTSTDQLDCNAIACDDQADIIAALLDVLRIHHVSTFVGASYGAMTGLSFAARHGDRLGRLIALAGTHQPHPLATAQRSIQRNILRLGKANNCTGDAISLARQLAMTTYRSDDEFKRRFNGPAEHINGRYQLPVESYLAHVGKAFADHFDLDRYLALSESIDLHYVDPAMIHIPVALIGFDSDRLVPLSDVFQLQQLLCMPIGLDVVSSRYGHDGFLKETSQLAPILERLVFESL